MEKQKKIALINDLTGFGRCSTAVMAPIVSALRIQAVAVPTAILSAHTQFPTSLVWQSVSPSPCRDGPFRVCTNSYARPAHFPSPSCPPPGENIPSFPP